MALPIDVGDLLEIVLQQVYNNQVDCKNVFHYNVASLGTGTGSPATVETFLMGFIHDVLPKIFGIESVDVVGTQVTGNIRSNITFALENGVTLPILTSFPNGARTGDALPPFVCWTFKYLRPLTSLRHGFKRFPGVAESDQQRGIVSGDAIITALGDLADQLQSPIPAYTVASGVPGTAISTASAFPVVVQRFREHTALDPIIEAEIATVVYDRIGTQNSRKFGVGT